MHILTVSTFTLCRPSARRPIHAPHNFLATTTLLPSPLLKIEHYHSTLYRHNNHRPSRPPPPRDHRPPIPPPRSPALPPTKSHLERHVQYRLILVEGEEEAGLGRLVRQDTVPTLHELVVDVLVEERAIGEVQCGDVRVGLQCKAFTMSV